MLDALSGSAQASALDLSQNGVGHFGIPRQHSRLNHVSTLLVGRLWGFVGVDILQTSTALAQPWNMYGRDLKNMGLLGHLQKQEHSQAL